MATSTFAYEFDVPVNAEAILGSAMREFVPFFGRSKYQVTTQTSTGITLTRRYLSGWGFFFGLITFPLGILIWALARSTQTISLTFTPLGPAGTRIVITGQGPVEVQEYAAILAQQSVTQAT
jgi:hypothetical protein